MADDRPSRAVRDRKRRLVAGHEMIPFGFRLPRWSPIVTPEGKRAILFPDGRILDEDAFYTERDHRTTVTGSYRTPVFPVAVALPPELVDSDAGQTALVWTASMLRRMGRPFASLVIAAPKTALETKHRGALHRHLGERTLGEIVTRELGEADPFAVVQWRDIEDAGVFSDVAMVVWIGGIPTGSPHENGTSAPAGEMVIGARGWVARVTTLPGGMFRGAQPLRPGEFDAATSGVVAAAALGVAAVYACAQGDSSLATGAASEPAAPETEADKNGGEAIEMGKVFTPTNWYSVDVGAVSINPEEGALWEARGSAVEQCPPWSAALGRKAPGVEHLVFVSAGGLCGNAGQILAASYLTPGKATVVEYDKVEVSNLNRSIGAGLADVGSSKIIPLAAALRSAGYQVDAVESTYEEWSRSGAAVALALRGTVVLTGVDQVGTRLEAQADWPYVIVNGGTGGLIFKVSVHPRGVGGCVGCLYGASRQPYADSRRAMGCANPSGPSARRVPDASYPFVTVAAAASMVAAAIRFAWEEAAGTSPQACVVAMNPTLPSYAQAKTLDKSPRCLLLCGHSALHEFFTPKHDVNRPAEGFAAAGVGPTSPPEIGGKA